MADGRFLVLLPTRLLVLGASQIIGHLQSALSPDAKKNPLNRYQPIACNPENPPILIQTTSIQKFGTDPWCSAC